MARSSLALAALATLAIPGLDVVATRPPQTLTDRFQTTGVLDSRGRHWVVRAPLTGSAGAAMEGEVAFLEQLAEAYDDGDIPFDIERPVGFAELSEGGRAVVIGELYGRPLQLELLDVDHKAAYSVGRAIARLHALDTSLVDAAGLPVYDMASYRGRRLREVNELAESGRLPTELLNRWEAALQDDEMWEVETVPVHGDLDAELIHVEASAVVAMKDFTSVHVGDPAEDLGWLVASASDEALDAAVDGYTATRSDVIDEFLLERAQLSSELLVAKWMLFGLRASNPDVIAEASQMLDSLATDIAADPPLGTATREARRAREGLTWTEDDTPAEGPTGVVRPATNTEAQPATDSGFIPTDAPADDAEPDGADVVNPDFGAADESDEDDVDDRWPAASADPASGEHANVDATAATADLTEEYAQWRREHEA